jgi:hypothetical protein
MEWDEEGKMLVLRHAAAATLGLLLRTFMFFVDRCGRDPRLNGSSGRDVYCGMPGIAAMRPL